MTISATHTAKKHSKIAFNFQNLNAANSAAVKGINIESLKRPRASVERDFDTEMTIGKGTYGRVDKATEKKTKRVVAIKKPILLPDLGEGISQATIREIALLKELNLQKHANIITLREVFVSPETNEVNLVYEYAEYELHQMIGFHIKNQSQMPFEMVRAIMAQLLSAVKFLHDNWVVHRDIKPSNVLVMGGNSTEMGVVKLADFGLARSMRDPLQRLNTAVATIYYRPPELLLGARSYSAAIDMWAVGCILGELVNGDPIFKGTEIPGQPIPFQEDQVKKILQKLGTPDVNDWPDLPKLSYWPQVSRWPKEANVLEQHFKRFGFDRSTTYFDLLSSCLHYEPSKRLTAAAAQSHEFFSKVELRANVFGSSMPPYARRIK